jgi:hypothetical protein
MGTDDAWSKYADRLRELSRDRATASYLLGRLCAGLTADDLADLAEACLVYRERFGASGNDRRPTAHEALNDARPFTIGVRHVIRGEAGFTPEMPDL